MDYFDFLNLFGFGRISQIYIIFLDIYVKQICGIWRRLFEFNISAFFIFACADSDCCINSACSRSSMTVYVRMYIGVLMRMLNVHVYLCAGVSRLPAILSECVIVTLRYFNIRWKLVKTSKTCCQKSIIFYANLESTLRTSCSYCNSAW